MDLTLTAEITKIDAKQKIVEGYATTTSVDRDNQVMDADFLQRAFPRWADKYGNIRLLHKPEVVGKVIKRSDFDGHGYYITAKISDPTTWKKIEDGELNGFSIGVKNPKIVPDPVAKRGRIVDGEIIETSVVDIPSNRDSDFMLIKSATFDESKMEWVDNSMDDITKGLREDIAPVDADEYKRYYSQRERKEMSESDFAGPHRSFPIKTQEDVDNAARLIGHAKDPEAVKRRIIEIAHRKGFKIPEAWQEDAKKDVTLDSGLQAPNLEGDGNKEVTMSDETKTTDVVETVDSAPTTDVEKTPDVNDMADTQKSAGITPELVEQLFNELKDIKDTIAALANQTDKDKDGDIDTEGNLETEAQHPQDPAPAQDFADGVEGKSTEADAPVLSDELAALVKSIVAEEVARALAEQADVSKSLVADETKSLVADVEKRVGEVVETLNQFTSRLETVEQMAAPAKGAVMERSDTATKTTSINEAWNILTQQAKQAPEDAQKQAFAALYKSTVLGGNN